MGSGLWQFLPTAYCPLPIPLDCLFNVPDRGHRRFVAGPERGGAEVEFEAFLFRFLLERQDMLRVDGCCRRNRRRRYHQ